MILDFANNTQLSAVRCSSNLALEPQIINSMDGINGPEIHGKWPHYITSNMILLSDVLS